MTQRFVLSMREEQVLESSIQKSKIWTLDLSHSILTTTYGISVGMLYFIFFPSGQTHTNELR